MSCPQPVPSLGDRGGTSTRSGALHRATLGLVSLLLTSCTSVPLEQWHTTTLDEEFHAARSGQVHSFADYLALEDRLFAELDKEVYAHVTAGPDAALLRYTSGSASDPQVRVPNWNRSFELKAPAPKGAVLLLHGMSDSPYSLRALGEALQARGYWVVGLRLPGHGTAPSGLLDLRWQDMAAAMRLAMAYLHEKVGDRPLHIVGYSTGAPLALDFALDVIEGRAQPMPASLVLVSPAIGIHAMAAAAQWKRRAAALPGLGGLGWLTVDPEFDPYKYNSFTTNAAEQVHRLTREVAGRIARLAQANQAQRLPPILVFKSNADATVSTGAVVTQLLARLDPGRHELVLFDVNRDATKSLLLVTDRRALDLSVVGDSTLPFRLTLVTNRDAESTAVEARTQEPYSAVYARTEPLALEWPPGVISLSHVALPIPPDDPLYGVRPPGNRDVLFLGQMAVQGERGTLRLSSDWLLRLRYNPFYPYLQARALDWIDNAGRPAADSAAAVAASDSASHQNERREPK
jgi:alpha-beta hydrolase superfamily lysophospholipase